MENNTNDNGLPPKVPVPKIINNTLDVPIANGRVDGDTIKIICPYCGRTHKHGYKPGGYPALRVAHCHREEAVAYFVTPFITEKRRSSNDQWKLNNFFAVLVTGDK
ncbi:hypothetical protein ACFLVW_02595 [Chloroflexota bacterium]